MPEVTIKYKKPETLKILKGLAKYFDFKVTTEKDTLLSVNGVTIIPANKNVDTTDLEKLFTEKNIDAAKLRKEAWQRKQ
ncbi:hypothetical protein BH09BAC6_BH09BAC6_04260 [soil metagenome]|jgi:hypothetical protein